ncbi:hypothetical protein AB0I68_34940 [Streptomyces sp. NPDC050448]|uniref:hypothetical protein n=1 Tax=Streptomyces sp. NPDC050448 TaxID=3155404 RepID=UPI003426C3B2
MGLGRLRGVDLADHVRREDEDLAGCTDDRIEATLIPEADHLRALLGAALGTHPTAAAS